jgi:hypothetical protein
MPTLYLSTHATLDEVPPASESADNLAGPYSAAFEGVVALCERHGWQVHHSREAGDRVERWLKSSGAFVALRFPAMCTALMPA